MVIAKTSLSRPMTYYSLLSCFQQDVQYALVHRSPASLHTMKITVSPLTITASTTLPTWTLVSNSLTAGCIIFLLEETLPRDYETCFMANITGSAHKC